MAYYRRNYVSGGTYFFTVVTFERRPIFNDALARELLRNAMETIRAKREFEIVAMVLLPDHLHAVWSLPRGDRDYSTRWQLIKESFTRSYLTHGLPEARRNASRVRRRERAVWQRRFWEHTCREEIDVRRCVDYVHWNPRKHGYVQSVRDWPWSTFHRFVRLGEYSEDWGADDPVPRFNDPEWGD